MKFISWNVNGFRACMKKGFAEFFADRQADCFCIQETKIKPEQIEFYPEGYKRIWNSAERKGYSGTAVFTKKEPETVSYGIEGYEDTEGRLITLEYKNFYLINCYSPNSQEKLARIDYRMDFEDKLRDYILGLEKSKPVVLCGDLNVAHREIDLKNPGPNRGNAGFSDQERDKFTLLLNSGHTDTFRYLYPDRKGAYSWWSYRFNARKNNAGWRIDYFVISDCLRDKIIDADILKDVTGSDHCPVSLELDI